MVTFSSSQNLWNVTRVLRVTVRKCVWLCFGYVIKFLMLILKMVFIFHKSKQAFTRVILTKLSKEINHMEISFCSNEQFCGAVITGRIRFRSQDSGRTKFAKLNQVWISSYIVELQPRHWGFESNRSSNEEFCRKVATWHIWFRSHDSDPTIQAAQNLLTWIKCESVVTSSSCNPGIYGLNTTKGHFSVFWSDSFSY